jgi:hypothetical protein
VPTDRQWSGFSEPTYTQVPDEFFDDLMVDLSESELRVLLYLIRRTFGFKKRADAISLKQIINGIQAKDGRVLDRGSGLSHTSVKRGIKGLVERGVIRVSKVKSEDGDYETNIYEIVFRGEGSEVAPGRQQAFLPPSKGRQEKFLPPETEADGRQQAFLPPSEGRQEEFPPVGTGSADGVGTRSALQETVKQQTEEQERDRSNYSNGHHDGASGDNSVLTDAGVMSRESVERISWLIADLAREFHDQAPLQSSVQRACNLFVSSGLDVPSFFATVQVARLRTSMNTGKIKAEPIELAAGRWVKPKMPYFFAILQNLLEPAEAVVE